MPVPPRTWVDSDPVTATYLNGDLYKINDAEFAPNGVRFHARKPFYKSTPNGAVSIPATSWQFAYQGVIANVLADSTGDYGNHMDPAFWGAVQSNVNGGGGVYGGVGGWHLISAFVPITTGNDAVLYAAAITKDSTSPSIYGTHQRGNTNHDSAPFVLDLVNMGSNSWSCAGYNGHSAALTTKSVTDDSGKTVRLQAHWACVSSGGVTASSAPAPKQSWLNTDTWSAAFANGNTGIRDVLNFLNYPPCFRGHQTVAQTPAASTATVMTLGGVDLDTYSGWSSGTNTYTVARSGIYLVSGYVSFNHPAAIMNAQCAVRINGTDYYGPAGNSPSSTDATAVTKTQIFSLNAGDTIQLIGWNDSGAVLTNLTAASRLVLTWLSGQGVPSPLPNVPDVTYRYTAGSQPDLSTLFNSHLANDLSFLVYRPYLLSYQGTAQTGIAQSADVQVNMDTVAGIIHADQGDNYSGWSSTNHNYVCQRTGWYLAVSEMMMQKPVLTASPMNIADFQVSNNNPSTAWDQYQQLSAAGPATGCSGATAVGYYYLRVGETITPGVFSADMTTTTVSTNVSTGRNSHFEMVWISE